MSLIWPWAKRPGGKAAPEGKGGGYGFVTLHVEGEAHWTRRDYSALAREGFMRNAVVHRSVRLVAETASAVPWLLYQGASELTAHPLLDLLARPNHRQAGASFMEALYGYLILSGSAYLERVDAGALAELHLLRPDRVAVLTDAAG
ncbi:MAG: phage portal protein, partial [Rhizobiaceae bacterium]